jgi:hypothetical protein
MKTEAGTFSVNSSSATILLNDTSFNVKGLFLQTTSPAITGRIATGFTDGVTNRSGPPRSTTYCLTAYSGTTRKVACRSVAGGFSTPGEFTLAFDDFDPAIPFDFIVYGD